MDGTDATRVRRWLDTVFGDRTLVDREELARATEHADLPEEVLGYVQELPPGHYGREEVAQHLIGPVTVQIPSDVGGRGTPPPGTGGAPTEGQPT